MDSLSGQYGIFSTQPLYISVYGDTVESKIYNSAYIDTSSTVPDTSWGPMVDGTSISISKGIGITVYQQGNSHGTFRGAIIDSDTLGVITSVSTNKKIYDKFNLDQNYPNPFNPTTVIQYSVPESNGVIVTLKVYDVLGNEVATLVNAKKKAGNYQIKFDANNLSSGVYFYKLTRNNFIETKKMLLLK